jgi:ubiquinone/menaquinone biosynthesis C-methylase UbiE
MDKERQYHDPELAQFYDWDCPWTPDFDWFASLVADARSVLDLGCGTGIFTAELAARGADAVGVDPAAAMLDIARTRIGGDKVTWVEADARGLDLGRRFEAVVMTGHALQALLTRADRATVLGTIARHLEPQGRFFFDSRNPAARPWENWTLEKTRVIRTHPAFGTVERWYDARLEEPGDIVRLDMSYRTAKGRAYSATSRLAFPTHAELSDLILAAGLRVDHWYGDALGGNLREGCPDLIPVGRLAPLSA